MSLVRDIILTFPQELAVWAMQHCISHAALHDLLSVLRSHMQDRLLPACPRTLLKTPRKANIHQLGEGKLCHIGILPWIQQNLSCYRPDIQTLVLQVNIDGLPLFKSSQKEFWPILGRLPDFLQSRPFPISVYCGCEKPPVQEFLGLFVQEALGLYEHGIQIGERKYKFEISAVICDRPAKSYVKCIKGYSGYYSCERCCQSGEYYEGRIIFPSFDGMPRTDGSFRQQTDEEHHIGISPFTDLP